MRGKRNLMAIVALAIQVILLLALASPSFAHDDDGEDPDHPHHPQYPPAHCSLALSKSVAEPGETVLASTVNCTSGCVAGATVTFALNFPPPSIFIRTATANADGTFTHVPLIVPEAPEGPHHVSATCEAAAGGTLFMEAALRIDDDDDPCDDEASDDEACDHEECDDEARDQEACDHEECDDEASDQKASDREECDEENDRPPASAGSENGNPPGSAGSGGNPSSARAAGATSTARNGGGSGNLAFTGSDSLPLLWLALVLLTIGTAFVLATRRRAQLRQRGAG